jgi:hypothetical protein
MWPCDIICLLWNTQSDPITETVEKPRDTPIFEISNYSKYRRWNNWKRSGWDFQCTSTYLCSPRSRIFLFIWRRHHCLWKAAKFRSMISIHGLWTGRDFYRATPAVIVQQIREEFFTWWYKHQIWHGYCPRCALLENPDSHVKIQDGGHFF